MITFAHGSLGFMANFAFDEHPKVFHELFKMNSEGLHKPSDVIGFEKRLRLKLNMGPGCKKVRHIYRGDQLQKYEEVEIKDLHILNEVCLDRGPSPYSVQLNIYLFDTLLTHTLGDGVIISTPTGSTAYNLSAGGSIVETTTQCIQLTPLAPHSLSFRPLVLPENTVVRAEKHKDNRSPAWVSLDGANRFLLGDGESIVVEGSKYPLLFVTLKTDNLTDLWSQRLIKFFGWNTREQNKTLQKHTKTSDTALKLYMGENTEEYNSPTRKVSPKYQKGKLVPSGSSSEDGDAKIDVKLK